jgi:hypothetical protein
MRTIAIGTLVVLGALATGCDDGSGGDPGTETEAPPPVGGTPRETPPVENPTPEALEACGYPPDQAAPAPGTDPALDACLRVIRGYPDPLRTPLELVRSTIAVAA